MKAVKFLLVFLIACAILSGCSSNTVKKPENVQKFLMKLKSYKCDVVYAVTNNKSTNVYRAQHLYKAPDRYRIEMVEPAELKGQITIYNKDKAYIYYPQINNYFTTENFTNSMEYDFFVGAFVEHFKNIGGARFSLENLSGKQCYVLQIPLDTDNRYRVVEKIWIDAEKALPIKAEILDKDNNVSAQVLYENFELNTNLEDSLFEIQAAK